MSPVLKLLYFEGCPNIENARSNLKSALDELGLTDSPWEEVDISHSETPKQLSGFPSPTILVNGCEVETGSRVSYGKGACRLGGAQTTQSIIKGIKLYRGALER